MMTIDPKEYIIKRDEVKDLGNFLALAESELGEYAKSFTSTSNFSIKNNSELVKIKLIKFDKDYLISEILEEIKKAGYKLPEAQDAIWFASQYPSVQMSFPVAFLHKPWVNPVTGGENVLILRSYGGLRYLHMHLFDSRWYSHTRFAVIEV